MKILKIMPDYDCFPLWDAEGINIDPSSLPINSNTIQLINDWRERYDQTLNRQDPVCSGFDSKNDLQSFKNEGEIIAILLRSELPDYAIELFNDVCLKPTQ